MPRELEEFDDYINQVSDIPQEDDTQDLSEVSDEGASDDRSDAPIDEQADAQAQSQTSKAPKQDKSDPAQARHQTQQLRPLGDGAFADGNGNIVDQNGKLIAQGGFAARMHTTNQRLRAQNEELTRQYETISRENAEYKALRDFSTTHGLSTEDMAQAFDYASRMKKGDFIGVAKDILAFIVSKGYNVTDLLGQDVGDSIETKAIRHMIDERLAPITREEQARQERIEAEQRARTAYNEFIRINEYAELHANEIATVMQNENIPPQTAYNRLREYAVRNQLDFTQPLIPQLEAKLEREQAGQQQQPQHANRKPMPNGGATRFNGDAPVAQLNSADDDWSTIISQAAQQVGMR